MLATCAGATLTGIIVAIRVAASARTFQGGQPLAAQAGAGRQGECQSLRGWRHRVLPLDYLHIFKRRLHCGALVAAAHHRGRRG